MQGLPFPELCHGGITTDRNLARMISLPGVSPGEAGLPCTELTWPGGCRVVLKEQGDEHLGRRSSDVALVVREELHPQFQRKGNNLLTRVEVPLVQALTSSYVQVPLLDGDTMEVCPSGMLPRHGLAFACAPGTVEADNRCHRGSCETSDMCRVSRLVQRTLHVPILTRLETARVHSSSQLYVSMVF